MLKHYIQMLTHGLIVPEEEHKEISERTLHNLNLPATVFGFRFYSREVQEVNGEILKGEMKDFSPLYYVNGTVYTAEEAAQHYASDSILMQNVRSNHYTHIITFPSAGTYAFYPDKGEVNITL